MQVPADANWFLADTYQAETYIHGRFVGNEKSLDPLDSAFRHCRIVEFFGLWLARTFTF